MRCVWGVLAVAASGCSLLFDPDALPGPPDLSVPEPPADMAVAPDDLTQPPADLLSVDFATCPPTVFPGFTDGGNPPFECPCGCTLDPLTATLSPARWGVFPTVGWSLSVSGGVMQMVKTVPTNGDQQFIYSDQHFYFEGDFDVRVDYQVASWPVGGRAQLSAIGPPVDFGGPAIPNQNALSYLGAMVRDSVSLDGDGHDVLAIPTSLSGTLQLTRKGSRICGGVIGRQTACRDNSGTGRVRILILAGVYSTTCVPSCGTINVRFSNLKLASGRVVATP
jgi:hypothetical protein